MYLRDFQYTLNKQRSLHYNDPLSNTSMYSNEENVPLVRTSLRNEERKRYWRRLEYAHVDVSKCINMWNLLTSTSQVVPWSIVDILGTTPSFSFYISIRNDPLNQFLQFKRLKASLTVNTILPQNLVSFRPVFPYQIVTSLIAWSRLLPPSHVATKWICPHTN